MGDMIREQLEDAAKRAVSRDTMRALITQARRAEAHPDNVFTEEARRSFGERCIADLWEHAVDAARAEDRAAEAKRLEET